jgi:hypothetical protein
MGYTRDWGYDVVCKDIYDVREEELLFRWLMVDVMFQNDRVGTVLKKSHRRAVHVEESEEAERKETKMGKRSYC